MRRFIALFVLSNLALVLSACSLSLAGDITPPPGSEQDLVQFATQPAGTSPVYPIVPPDLANGAVLYNNECAPCHGVRGLGDGPQASQLSIPAATLGLTEFSRLRSPSEWYTIVTQGDMDKFMPPFANLTDRQRWDVVAYAMNLGVTDETLTLGKSLYLENCAACHGSSGTGDGSQAASMATLPGDLTEQSLMAQSSSASLYQAISTGIPPDMPSFGDSLDDNARWALVAYLRSLTYAPSRPSAEAYPAPEATTVSESGAEAYPAPQTYPEPLVAESTPPTSTAEVSSAIPSTGSVTVQLVNGSGGEAPSDAAVTLYGFDSMQNTYSETLTTGIGGVYAFTNVSMPEGRSFLAGIEYASGTFGSDIVTVDPNTPNLNVIVTVYDSTTDTSVLTTDRVHIFFDFADSQNLQVIEVFIISNSSQQAVVSPAPDGAVVTFPLPEGYSNLQFNDGALGDRYVEVPQGFADKMTVRPGVGDYQVIFAFQLPFSRKLDFIQPMFLPTNAVVIMLPEGGMSIDSNQLEDGGTRDFQGATYHMYDGGSLIAGSALEFSLSGAPGNAITSIINSAGEQNLAIGLGVFGLTLVAAGLWLFRRNQLSAARQGAAAGAGAMLPGVPDAIPQDEESLMDAIIALDDQFHAGNLPEGAYLKRRAALKDRLRQVEQG